MVDLLYVMHVDWRWIKQRPHFIAEELVDSGLDLQVVDRRLWRTDVLTPNPTSLNIGHLRALPGRLQLPRSWDDRLIRAQLTTAIDRTRPKALWLTHPTLFSYLTPRQLGIPIVYDAMDDHVALASSDDREAVDQAERALVARASLIFASSDSIRQRLSGISSSDPLLVRNAMPTTTGARAASPADSTDVVRLGYVGTVSHWFDFETVLDVLESLPWLEVHLFGPADVDIPEHDRLVVHGAVPRHELEQRVSECHAFVMPFLDNEIVRAVDPVKVYEYLSWARPTFVSEGAETEHFGQLITRFSGSQELISALSAIRGHERANAPNREAVEAFLDESTWRARGLVMRTALQARLGL